MALIYTSMNPVKLQTPLQSIFSQFIALVSTTITFIAPLSFDNLSPFSATDSDCMQSY
jgi:hypothetical protein